MKKLLHKISGIVISVATAIAGISLATGCIMIYLSGGDTPFSRGSVADVFGHIQIPVYLSLILIAGGFILDLLTSDKKAKEKISPDEGMNLEIKKRVSDISAADTSLLKRIRSCRTFRFIAKAALFILLAAELVAYVLLIRETGILSRGGADTESVTQNTVDALAWLLPFVAFALGITVLHSYLNSFLIKKEISLLSSLPYIKDRSKVTESIEKANDNSDLSITVVRIAIICAAVVLAVYGFIAGGYMDVLGKAVAICTECIGLG